MVKKEKKKGEKAIVGPAAPPEINENNKEYYIVQIKDLEDRVSAWVELYEILIMPNYLPNAWFLKDIRPNVTN